jgi:hypothetical protein
MKTTMTIEKAINAVLSHQKWRQPTWSDMAPEMMGAIIRDPM